MCVLYPEKPTQINISMAVQAFSQIKESNMVMPIIPACYRNRPNIDPLPHNDFPFQTTCHSLENMILCLSRIHIYASSHAQPLKKGMILLGMTRGLKWENIVFQRIRSIGHLHIRVMNLYYQNPLHTFFCSVHYHQ